MKIVTIIGARPQFIKAAIVSRAIKQYETFTEVIVHTGQHFDKNMSDIFFEEMEIPTPDYNLEVNGLDHGAMTGQMLEKIEKVLKIEQPDWVLVYGDTNSTLAGALAAKKLHMKVAHVEAGLRSYNNNMPEEINRILTDRISDLLFCPTETAIKNLETEGFSNISCSVVKVGDVMQDAAIFYSQRARKPDISIDDHFILATIHRAESTDNTEALINIFEALASIAETKQIIMPLHPRTRSKLSLINFNINDCKITFIDPVGYLEMVYLLNNCDLVMTDSGGLQKEAYFFKKMCITLREETEWTELVTNGYNFLCGHDKKVILEQYNKMTSIKDVDFGTKLYGSGNSGDLIVAEIQAKSRN